MGTINKIDRRKLMALGAISGATAIAALGGVGADPANAATNEADQRDIAASKIGMTYLGIDGFGFFPDSPTGNPRIYQDSTGVQPTNNPARMNAPLMLPAGSTIYELSSAHYGTPILEIWSRPMTAPTPYQTLFQQTLPSTGGGAQSTTINLVTPLVIAADSTYALRVRTSAGHSLFGVRVGYRPPSQSFVPFGAGNARAFNGPLQPNVAKKVATGNKFARSVVFNLIAVNPSGTGRIACYAGTGPASNYPNLQYTKAVSIQNLVICPVDAVGAINLRVTGAATAAIVDIVGYMI